MKKTTLLASFSAALLVSVTGCASTPAAKPDDAAAAAKPAEGSCGADKKPAEGSCGAKAGEGSCGEGSCGAAPK